MADPALITLLKFIHIPSALTPSILFIYGILCKKCILNQWIICGFHQAKNGN